MNPLVAIVLLFAAAASALGADPVARIVGPKNVQAGKIFSIDGRTSIGTDHQWEVYACVADTAGKFTLTKESYFPGEGNKLVGFSSPFNGLFLFTLAVSGDKGKTSLVSHVVEITGGIGPTPAPPGPSPGPAPPGPGPSPGPSKFGLDKFVSERVTALPAPAKLRAPAVATALRAVTGQFDTLNAIQIASATTKAFNDAVTPEHASAWKPVSDAIQAQLRALNLQGKLKTRADLKTAYQEICTGLESIKQEEGEAGTTTLGSEASQ